MGNKNKNGGDGYARIQEEIMNNWVSVADRVPLNGTPVIGLFEHWQQAVVTYWDGDFVTDAFVGEIYGTEGLEPLPLQPTHWMPLNYED